MSTFDQWMNEYGVSHQHPTNQTIHKICVPLIMLSVIGFLWSLPIPDYFQGIAFLNWAIVFLILCLVFYFYLNVKMFLGMLVQSILMCWVCYQIEQIGFLLPFCTLIFIGSWIAQFYGHKIEGKKPSFLKDIIFLLIGPLWVTRFLYKKMGIKV
jgi:uncharacterized membrane protein YGL010W